MSSSITIVEDSLAGRLSLSSALALGQQEVFTMSSAQWFGWKARDRTDLLVIGPTAADMERLLDDASDDEGGRVPVIVARHDATPDVRLGIIARGAREIVDYPARKALLLAIVRAVRREEGAYKEVERRKLTALGFGFSEASPGFIKAETVAVVADRRSDLDPLECGRGVGWTILRRSAEDVLAGSTSAAFGDAYILDWRDSAEMSDVRAVLPELRSHERSRHAALMVVHDANDEDAPVQALNYGASDIVSSAALPDEIACRMSRLLRLKEAETALRRTTERTLELAATDALTGLHNRRYVTGYLGNLLRDEKRAHPFALIIADIDHFKTINDRFGHVAGDKVLKEIAVRLRDGTRSSDLVGRIGGEEFLVILNESDFSLAGPAAERLRRLVSYAPVAISEARSVEVSMSFGVALCEVDGARCARRSGTGGFEEVAWNDPAVADLVGLADDALYRAKALGRNRVELAFNPAGSA